METQPPVAAAVCIPLDGPCSQYAYRWATHQAYQQGDLGKYIHQVSLVPQELEKCERNPRAKQNPHFPLFIREAGALLLGGDGGI